MGSPVGRAQGWRWPLSRVGMAIVGSANEGRFSVVVGDGHRCTKRWPFFGGGLVVVVVEAEDVGEERAVDAFEFPSCSTFERIGGDAVDVAQAAIGRLVHEGDGIAVEGVGGVGTACVLKSLLDVLGGVVGCGLSEMQAGMNARPEGAVTAETQAGVELREADEHEAQQGFAVPRVVGEDV